VVKVRTISRNRMLAWVAALAVTALVGGCGGGGASRGTPANKKCLLIWNQPGNARARLGPAILALDLGGTPAALIQAKTSGQCQMFFGAIDSSYLFHAYIYYPAEKAYVEENALEGPGRMAPIERRSWNAKVNSNRHPDVRTPVSCERARLPIGRSASSGEEIAPLGGSMTFARRVPFRERYTDVGSIEPTRAGWAEVWNGCR
jgi:hypothetical protein